MNDNERTNCKNCGAPLNNNGVCDYCETIHQYCVNSTITVCEEHDSQIHCLGKYDSEIDYQKGYTVTYNGSSYMYINATSSSGNLPTDTDYWMLMESKDDNDLSTTDYTSLGNSLSNILRNQGVTVDELSNALNKSWGTKTATDALVGVVTLSY